MRIAIINNIYAPQFRGGAGVIAKTQVDSLERAGHSVIVITTKPYSFKDPGDQIYRMKSLYHSLGRLPVFVRLFWHAWNQLNFLNGFKALKIIKDNNIDLVITHNLTGISLILPLFLHLTHIKHIHYLHDIQLLHPSGLVYAGQEKKLETLGAKIYQSLNKYFFKSVWMLVAPSKWIISEHRKRGFFVGTRIKHILNPIDQDFLEDAKPLERIGFKFLFVGQLERHKGLETLIKAFGELERGDIQLEIIGAGAKPEVQGNIIFSGKKNKQEIIKAMKNADCLIMPSICYENSPTVIYEASACGLPTIASNIGGTTELIKYFGGYLFEANDTEELALKMRFAVKNKGEIKKIGQIARGRATDLSSEVYVGKLLDSIKGIGNF